MPWGSSSACECSLPRRGFPDVPYAVDEAIGVETHFGGTVGDQALIRCHDCPRQAQPDRVTATGERLQVHAADDTLLWTRTATGRISQAEIGDLDGDGSREVVVGVSTDGSDTGRMRAFDCKGNELWSVDTTAPSPYARAGTSGRLAVARLALADLFGSGAKEILALSHDAQGWFPSRLSIIDNDLGAGLEGGEYVDAVLLFDPTNEPRALPLPRLRWLSGGQRPWRRRRGRAALRPH